MKVSILAVPFAFAAGVAAGLPCQVLRTECGPPSPPTGRPINCFEPGDPCDLLRPGNGIWWIFGWRPETGWPTGGPRYPIGYPGRPEGGPVWPDWPDISDAQVTDDVLSQLVGVIPDAVQQRRSLGITALPRQLIRKAIFETWFQTAKGKGQAE